LPLNSFKALQARTIMRDAESNWIEQILAKRPAATRLSMAG
jgi:hypothetical protein